MKSKLSIAIALILTAFASTAAADPVGGAQSDTGILSPGASDSYRVPLNADEVTLFKVQGDGDGDLDCYLYDDNGNLVGSDTDETDTCLVRVNPRWPEAFRFVVTNHGHIYDAYRFLVY